MENWIYKRYQKLQPVFRENDFRFEDAAKQLKKEFGDEEKQVLTILSTMKKEGLLEARKDSENARRKIYNLLKPAVETVKGIGGGDKLTREDVEKILKRGADLIRTRVDYKFILVLLFLKRISDKWQKEYEEEYKKAKADGFSEKEAKKEAGN